MGQRENLFFSRNKRENHIDLLHHTTEGVMETLMDRYVGLEWEQRFDALEMIREEQRTVVETEPPHGISRDEEGDEAPIWAGVRRTDENTSAAGYYARYLPDTHQVGDGADPNEAEIEFRPLITGLDHENAQGIADIFKDYLAEYRTLQVLEAFTQDVVKQHEMQRRTHHNFMGWTQLDEQWVYVSPGVCIGDDSPLSDKPQVELGTRLRDSGLAQSSWEDSLSAFQAALKVLPRELAPVCLAFALLPIVQRWFPAAAPKPALHLSGTTGSGKSEIAAMLTSFYGSFTRDTPPAQWGDTINTVETLGYALADAVYWVDDYKPSYVDERTFTRFLQSYSRGMGRGRLTREAKLRQERPCRGLLLSTGEATIEGEASVLARMLVLDVPSWEKRDPRRQALTSFEPCRQHLSGFTAHFAAWVAQQADTQASTLLKELSNGYASSVRGYQEKLSAAIGNQSSTGRIIMNWAVLVTVYRLLRRFLESKGCDEVLPGWQDTIVETAKSVRQERASELFLDVLGQLLANGQVILASDLRNPEEPRPGCVMVGCRTEQYIYLMPDLAYREVCRVQPLKFTVAAIGAQLRDEGWLIPSDEDRHLTVQVRLRGIKTRMWRLKAQVLTTGNEAT